MWQINIICFPMVFAGNSFILSWNETIKYIFMTHSCHLPLGHLEIFLMLRTWATCKKMISRSDSGAHVQRMPAGIGGVKWTVALNLDWLILSFFGNMVTTQRDIASWVILTIPDFWPIYTSSDFVLVVESVCWFLKIVDPKCSINNKEFYSYVVYKLLFFIFPKMEFV